MYELLKDLRTLDDETISFDEELKNNQLWMLFKILQMKI